MWWILSADANVFNPNLNSAHLTVGGYGGVRGTGPGGLVPGGVGPGGLGGGIGMQTHTHTPFPTNITNRLFIMLEILFQLLHDM